MPPEDNTGLFTESIYKEFQRYLQPPLHTLNEGKEITYTSTQQKYLESKPVHEKIRGVAGSGKTVLMAKRAVDAHIRHGERVLILTYNLTLKSYIHDKISDVRENFNWSNFYIINYHEFFKQIANYLGIDIQLSDAVKKQLEKIFDPRERDRIKEAYFEKMFYSNLAIFDEYAEDLDKYQSIFIDEIQDYKPEWIKLIRKYFTNENAELVLFGDEKQNIYERSLDTEKKFTTPQGFGEWKKLKQSIRQQENGNRVLDLLKKFQKAFFTEKYELDEYEIGRNQKYIEMGIFKFLTYENLSLNTENISSDNGIYKIVSMIFDEIRANHIHPNDVCIISSRISTLQKIDFVIRNSFNERTICTFESLEIIEKMSSNKMNETSNLRRSKKIGFNLNSGVIKLSTIHSFKGFESKVVFLIINNDEIYEDTEELIYAGISRSKSELMIFSPKHSRYNEFFSAEMNTDKTEDGKNLLEELKECVVRNMSIDIQYEVHGEIVEHLHVKPYKILFMNENFYLACEVNNDYTFTMFRISKIRNITLTENIFYKNPDIVDFINDIQTPFAKYQPNYKDHLVQVKVEVHHSKADFFKTKQFLPSQTIAETKENGNLILVFTVTRELEVEELIKKWLPFLKVLEPLTLDEKIKNDIKSYLD
ncbi:WYL domain-containing protein [Sulfuricurvum sp.]|uniref:AAA family ATPase n=1 Tax=Sulfuricurvum sp. TaxID=2025608 RepID=UPI00262D0FF3|nr:WYL domain-containing protein [Sulfuricurvum sp.]MDD3594857.1 WYL domain-containing protein [Sulfuricurvum sp.]